MDPLQQEAASPTTPPVRLAELAGQHPELWPAIVANPQCDPAWREWILAQRPDLRPAGGVAAAGTAGATGAAAAAPASQVAGGQAPQPVGSPATAGSGPREPGGRKRTPVWVPIVAVASLLVLLGGIGVIGFTMWPRADETAGPSTSAPTESAAEGGLPPEDGEGRRWDSESAEETGSASPSTTAAPTEESMTAAPSEESTTGSPEPDSTASASPTSPPAYTDPPTSAAPQVIQSPSHNIGCEIGTDYVGCTVADRDESVVGCAGDPTASYAVHGSGPASRTCSSAFLGSPGDAVTTLEYGQKTTHGDFACSSESDGMTCWNQETGSGFTVSRTTAETY